MKTTHDGIQDLPMRKAKQSRPTREEILEGIGYEPLTFPASLRVPEALRAEEDRAMQDYIVAWTQGLWDFVHAHETSRTRARSAPRASMKASTREMSVVALPIVATRDRSQNWKQRSGLEKSPASHGLIRRGSNQAAHQHRNPFDFPVCFAKFRQAARNGSTNNRASIASSFLARRHCRGGPFLLLAEPLTHNDQPSRDLKCNPYGPARKVSY
jgi:hypothetical protein